MAHTEDRHHEVAQGETTVQLALEAGHYWSTVWQHSSNAQLRQLRKHHNVLLPGDVLFIPAIRVREVSKATDQTHKFVRKGIPEKFNLQFLDYDNKPLADAPYVLTLDGTATTGNLDGDGWLRVFVRPDICSGRIEVGEHGSLAACDLNFGHLDPLATMTGVQARLRNLGLYDGPIDGEVNDLLKEAVRAFRLAEELPEGDEINDELRQRLEAKHRS
ncbi:MAG: peptidoglycan-binding domain-containing protein [Acidobacteria bacterium]|nr:peptidoglycan-binding domain-containing protein [Acidobacteriota bacterium]